MDLERVFSSEVPIARVPHADLPKSLVGGGVHGVARWLTTQETIDAGLYDFGGVTFGQNSQGKYLTYCGDGHSMIVAPPGSGKGVGFVIPNLIFYPGSMLVIDPKGENAAQTAKHRRDVLGHDVYVLDPCGVTGLPSNSYNPLAWLERSKPQDFMSELRTFAEAVIESGFGKESYWTNCARSLFVGLVCYLAAHDPDNLNLNEVYRLTRLPQDEWLQLMQLMSHSTCPVPELQRWTRDAGAWYLGQEEAHQKYHLGTVQEATSWMGNLGAARVMGHSDFEMRDLKRKPTTIYLCVHPNDLTAYRGWFRLIASQAIMSVFLNIGKPKHPVVFLLDEFARAVGRLTTIDNAIPQIRGYGGRFAFVLQTIGQLKELYPDSWSTFEETSAVCVYLQSSGETAEHVSKRLGPTTVSVMASAGFSQTGRPLLYPQEISSLPELDEIVFVQGLAPMRCKRITSYNDGKISKFLSASHMNSWAMPASSVSSAEPMSLIDQARAAAKSKKSAPPNVTPEQKADAARVSNGGWEDEPPFPSKPKSADEREAALLSSLSKRCGKRVVRSAAGIFGYYDENQKFVELE